MDIRHLSTISPWTLLEHADYVPFLSTLTNLTYLFHKHVWKLEATTPVTHRYCAFIEGKHSFRCIVLLFPFAGNLLIAFYDFAPREEQRKEQQVQKNTPIVNEKQKTPPSSPSSVVSSPISVKTSASGSPTTPPQPPSTKKESPYFTVQSPQSQQSKTSPETSAYMSASSSSEQSSRCSTPGSGTENKQEYYVTPHLHQRSGLRFVVPFGTPSPSLSPISTGPGTPQQHVPTDLNMDLYAAKDNDRASSQPSTPSSDGSFIIRHDESSLDTDENSSAYTKTPQITIQDCVDTDSDESNSSYASPQAKRRLSFRSINLSHRQTTVSPKESPVVQRLIQSLTPQKGNLTPNDLMLTPEQVFHDDPVLARVVSTSRASTPSRQVTPMRQLALLNIQNLATPVSGSKWKKLEFTPSKPLTEALSSPESSPFIESVATSPATPQSPEKREPLTEEEKKVARERLLLDFGLRLLYGIEIPQNPEAGIKILQELSEHKNDEAEFALGVYYEEQKKDEEAVSWFRKAFIHNNMDAALHLALCYQEGRGVRKRPSAAFVILDRAVKERHEGALEVWRQMGLSVAFDLPEPSPVKESTPYPLEDERLFQEEMSRHYKEEAIIQLAVMSLTSDYPETGVELLLDLAEKGNPHARYRLAICQQQGVEGVLDKDEEAAAKAFEALAEEDHLESILEYAICLEEEKGVTQNEAEALKFYERASRRDNQEATERLESLLKRIKK